MLNVKPKGLLIANLHSTPSETHATVTHAHDSKFKNHITVYQCTKISQLAEQIIIYHRLLCKSVIPESEQLLTTPQNTHCTSEKH